MPYLITALTKSAIKKTERKNKQQNQQKLKFHSTNLICKYKAT